MSPRALVDPKLVQPCAALAADFDVFRAEASAASAELFVPWLDGDAYSEGWLVLPFVMAIDPLPPGFDLARGRRACPRTCASLARHEQLRAAAISRFLPGCQVFPHQDRPKPGVLRFHLALDAGGHAALKFEDGEVSLRPGESLLFDHSLQHAAHNSGPEPRDVLLVDIQVSAADADTLRRTRGGVNLGPVADDEG